MKLLINILLITLMFGCASNPASSKNNAVGLYIAQYEQQMKNGELPRSTYYTGLYNAFSSSSFSDKGINMKLLASLIEDSKKMESGLITKDEFETLKMKHIAEFEIDRTLLSPTAQSNQPYVYIPTKQAPPPKLQSNKTCTSTVSGNNVYTTCN